MKKFSLIAFLLASVLTLSGCSQEPAPETLTSSRGDYSYLSRAIKNTSTPPSSSAASVEKTQSAATNEEAAMPPTPHVPESGGIADPPQKPPETEGETTGPTPEESTSSNGEKSGDLKLIKKYSGAIMNTSEGAITIKFYSDDAPKTVENFLKLAHDDFYNGIRFHRIIKGFIIQAGDPNSKDDNWADDGQGGPGYTFGDEINSRKLVQGSIAMANAGPNTNGSQFFIVTAKSTPLLDGRYTNFGEVTDGMDVVRKIEKVDTDKKDHPKENVTIENIELIEKK